MSNETPAGNEAKKDVAKVEEKVNNATSPDQIATSLREEVYGPGAENSSNRNEYLAAVATRLEKGADGQGNPYLPEIAAAWAQTNNKFKDGVNEANLRRAEDALDPDFNTSADPVTRVMVAELRRQFTAEQARDKASGKPPEQSVIDPQELKTRMGESKADRVFKLNSAAEDPKIRREQFAQALLKSNSPDDLFKYIDTANDGFRAEGGDSKISKDDINKFLSFVNDPANKGKGQERAVTEDQKRMLTELVDPKYWDSDEGKALRGPDNVFSYNELIDWAGGKDKTDKLREDGSKPLTLAERQSLVTDLRNSPTALNQVANPDGTMKTREQLAELKGANPTDQNVLDRIRNSYNRLGDPANGLTLDEMAQSAYGPREKFGKKPEAAAVTPGAPAAQGALDKDTSREMINFLANLPPDLAKKPEGATGGSVLFPDGKMSQASITEALKSDQLSFQDRQALERAKTKLAPDAAVTLEDLKKSGGVDENQFNAYLNLENASATGLADRMGKAVTREMVTGAEGKITPASVDAAIAARRKELEAVPAPGDGMEPPADDRLDGLIMLKQQFNDISKDGKEITDADFARYGAQHERYIGAQGNGDPNMPGSGENGKPLSFKFKDAAAAPAAPGPGDGNTETPEQKAAIDAQAAKLKEAGLGDTLQISGERPQLYDIATEALKRQKAAGLDVGFSHNDIMKEAGRLAIENGLVKPEDVVYDEATGKTKILASSGINNKINRQTPFRIFSDDKLKEMARERAARDNYANTGG